MSTFDIIIRNGTIVDGTRMPKYVSDIGIKGNKITQIGGLKNAKAAKEIDATGLIVAPGFIDTHTHYDAQIFWDPYCTASGWNGVTSLAIGCCGFGFAPCRPEDRERTMLSFTRNEQVSLTAMREGVPWNWEGFGEFMNCLESAPKGVNLVTYAPMGALTVYAMDSYEQAKKQRPNGEQLQKLKKMLHECMDDGAVGFSYQRLGQNSIQPDFDGTPMVTDVMSDEEGYAMAEVLAERGDGQIQITYADFPDRLENMFESNISEEVYAFEEKLCEISGRPLLHNSAQAIQGMPFIHESNKKWLQSCHERGLQVYGQGVNFFGSTQFRMTDWNVFDFAPNWKAALLGTTEQKLANLKDPGMRQRLIADRPFLANAEAFGSKISDYRVVHIPDSNPELKRWVGKTLGEISEAEGGKDVLEVLIDLGIATELQVEVLTAPLQLDPHGTCELIRTGLVTAGLSDGGAHTKMFIGASFPTDLLAHKVRDLGALSLEDAHYALSGLPAKVVGFKDRGIIRQGAPADIVVYDLKSLKMTPDDHYETAYDLPGGDWRRVKKAEGYRYTIVNGVITFVDGECTGATPGHLDRHGNAFAAA